MAPRIVLHPKHAWADKWLQAFVCGLRRHDLESTWSQEARECELAVLWGISQVQLIDYYRANGTPFIVIECGFVTDRLNFASAGYGGRNGRGDFRNESSPGDRWREHAHLMRPWRSDAGGYVLILGQVAGDRATRGVNLRTWYRDATAALKEQYLIVAFRPHPQGGSAADCPDDALLLAGSLDDAFAGASCAVTYNSNSGADAVLAGVPTIALDRGSMAWPVSAHRISDASAPLRPARTQWAHNLGYAQWRESEFRSGLVWEHLKPSSLSGYSSSQA